MAAQDKARVHQFDKNAERNVLGPCATCGERLVKSLDDSRL